MHASISGPVRTVGTQARYAWQMPVSSSGSPLGGFSVQRVMPARRSRFVTIRKLRGR